MRHIKTALASLVLFVSAPAMAVPILLDFEGDTGSATRVIDHKGFDFTGSRGDASWVKSPSFFNVVFPTSGNFLAWSNGGAELQFSGGGLFSFQSAWLAGRNGNCAGGGTLQQTVRGFVGGSEVANTQIALGCTGQLQQFTFGGAFASVDRIQFDEHVVNLILDDLLVDTLSVPEPGTLALFGIGLVGLGLTRRRRKV